MLISLTGPSGVGKGYIKERILETFPEIMELTWTTTRPLRTAELVRSNRRNVTRASFEALNEGGSLICVHSLHGYFYGLEKGQLRQCERNLCITETHIDNMTTMIGFVEDFLPIALVPNDVTFLHKRLTTYRRETGDDLESRVRAADEEVSRIKCDPRFVLIVEVSKETEVQIAKTIIAFLEGKVREHKGGRT